jgi:hypothetical protein
LPNYNHPWMSSYAILYEVAAFKIGIFSLWPLNLKTGINQFNNAAMMITVGRECNRKYISYGLCQLRVKTWPIVIHSTFSIFNLYKYKCVLGFKECDPPTIRRNY